MKFVHFVGSYYILLSFGVFVPNCSCVSTVADKVRFRMVPTHTHNIRDSSYTDKHCPCDTQNINQTDRFASPYDAFN
jgi:hypothetical protein